MSGTGWSCIYAFPFGAKYDTGFSMPRRVRIDAPGALHHILGVGGYDFSKAVNRVAGLFDMKPQEILFPGNQAQSVKARSQLCYWAVKELGISTTSVANKPGMHQLSASRKAPASRHRKKRINV